MGLIFIANSYTAFFAPDEFTELVKNSFLTSVVPFSAETIVKLIGVSDGLVGILLILGLFRKYVSVYAAAWIIGVILVSGFGSVGDTLEHIGILAVPVYLFLNPNEV